MAGDGSLSPIPAVAGRRDETGWRVWISGAGVNLQLDPARARQLAQDIADMCDVLDGVHGSVLRQAQDERCAEGGA